MKAAGTALKAIPVVGQIAALGMAAYDAVDGWKNADKIAGKNKEDLTTTDKSNAAVASVLSGLSFGLYDAQTAFKHVEAIQSYTAGLLSGTLDDQEREKQVEQAKQVKQAKIEEANADYAMKDRSSVDAILQKQQSGEELSAREKAKLNMYEKDENGNLKVDQHGNYIISERGQDAYIKELSKPVSKTLLFSKEELRLRNEDAKNIQINKRQKAMASVAGIQKLINTQYHQGGELSPFLAHKGNAIKNAIISGNLTELKKLQNEINRISVIYFNAIREDWGYIRVRAYGNDGYTPENEKIPKDRLEIWVHQQSAVNSMIENAKRDIEAALAADKAYRSTDAALATRLVEELRHNDKYRNNTKWWNARG